MIGLTVIAAAGALQGIAILLSMLFRLRHRRNLPLVLLITVFSIRLATIPTWNYDVLLHRPWLWPATTALPFLFAPLVWWHIRDMVSEKPRPLSGLLPHCLPWLVEVILLCLSLFSMDETAYKAFLEDVFSGRPPLWLPVRNGLKVLVNVVYLVLASVPAFGKRGGLRSPAKRLWMRSLVIVPSVVLLSFAAVAVIPSATEELTGGDAAPFLMLSVFMSLLILLIATFFMVCPELFAKTESPAGCGDRQFPEPVCRELLERLERRMERGAFRNPDLSLPDLASEFGVNINLLSHTVNCYGGMGFRSYINEKRLNYFLKELERAKDVSLLELAFDSGFSSKSTFNRVFHEQMAMTPTEYLGRKKKDSEISPKS